MIRRLSFILAITLLQLGAFPAQALTKPGDSCSKIGQTKTVRGVKLICETVKKKKVWVAKKESKDSSSPSNTQPITIVPQEWIVQTVSIVQESDEPSRMYSPEKTVKVGDKYRSYFVSKVNSFLVFNESSDGVNYTKQVKTNLQRSASLGTETTMLDHPVVLPLKNGKFLLFYDICTGECNVPPSLPRRLAYRFSDDGIQWGPATMLPEPPASGRNPEGKIFDSVPTLLQLPSGDIRLYYVQGGAAIGSAISRDNGTTWKIEEGFRLGTPYGAKPLLESFIDPAVMQDNDGTIYLYFGYVTDWRCMEGAGTPQGCVPLRVARSSDGLNFKMDEKNAITPGPGATQIGDPDPFVGPDGKWILLFADVSNNKQFTSTLGWAVRNK